MVAGLTNMEHQNKILTEAATLTMLQQKFNRLVSQEMTDWPIDYSFKLYHAPHHNGQHAEVRLQAAVKRKLRPQRPYSTPSPAEDDGSIYIPIDQWTVWTVCWPRWHVLIVGELSTWKRRVENQKGDLPTGQQQEWWRRSPVSSEPENAQRVLKQTGGVKATPRPLLPYQWILHLEENAWVLLTALHYHLTKWLTMYVLRERRPTFRNLKWLTHEWHRWKRQCIGGWTAQLTGRKNGVTYAAHVIKWMPLSRKLQSKC